MRLIRRVSVAAAVAIAAALMPLGTSHAAGTGAIHPGVQTFTSGAQCTANFIFKDAANTYIGQAAHCSGTGGNTATDGCTSGSLPIGTAVTVTGASKPGKMVYNSWLTMQTAPKETNPDVCAYNDLALIQLDPADAANVDPSIPFWGGPGGINSAGTVSGDKVYSYGNSELRGGTSQLSPKTGISLGDTGSGWSHVVSTASPGIPGDSGSAFLDKDGKALGILSTIQVGTPGGVQNGVGDVNKELAYAQAHGFAGVALINGTTAFNGGRLPVGVGVLGL
ncbi:MAG: serine protease [Acidimicrobiales bacterium]|jgi:hypothetical protein|nr:serine protease [Acidimicrobiales bacterium]